MGGEFTARHPYSYENKTSFIRVVDLRWSYGLGIYCRMGSAIEYTLLESYCLGMGLNLCCQHTQIADSIGVDTNPNARAAMVICDVRALPFPTGKLDYVICHHGLEHIRDAPLYVVHEWFRVLKPGGILAIIVPDGSAGESALNYGSFKGELTEYGHGHLFTMDTLKEIISFAGGLILESKVLDRDHGTRTLFVAAAKTHQHTPGFQPFSKPIEAMRVLQKDGLLSFVKRLIRRVKCGIL